MNMGGTTEMKGTRFAAGDQIVLRYMHDNYIYKVMTAIVVYDTPELIALYWGPGYPMKTRRNPLHAPFHYVTDLKDGTWTDTDVLMLVSPATESHAVCAMWKEDGERTFLGWQINLQAPLRRSPVGFDTADYLLDITLSPDRSQWTWKGERNFDMAVATGKLPRDLAESIRMEGEEAIQWMQEGPDTYYEAWQTWMPSRRWKIPRMPHNWHEGVSIPITLSYAHIS